MLFKTQSTEDPTKFPPVNSSTRPPGMQLTVNTQSNENLHVKSATSPKAIISSDYYSRNPALRGQLSNKSSEGAKPVHVSSSSQQLANLLKRRSSEEKKEIQHQLQTQRSGASKDYLDGNKQRSPKVMSTQKLSDLQSGSDQPHLQSQMFQHKNLMQSSTQQLRLQGGVNYSAQNLPGMMPRSPDKQITYSTQNGPLTKSRNNLQGSTSAGSSGIKYKSSQTKPGSIQTSGITYSSSPKLASNGGMGGSATKL